jgi:hypothetical protein
MDACTYERGGCMKGFVLWHKQFNDNVWAQLYVKALGAV